MLELPPAESRPVTAEGWIALAGLVITIGLQIVVTVIGLLVFRAVITERVKGLTEHGEKMEKAVKELTEDVHRLRVLIEQRAPAKRD